MQSALRKTVIAVCGTTGVGKSQFAIDMALSLPCGAKIINADAMQAYEGSDVLTNKVPITERKGVEHVLMSFKKPGEQYIVGEWVRDAIREIDDAHSKGKVPIVVGGTAYWIHHLLFLGSLPSNENCASLRPGVQLPSIQLQKALEALPNELLSMFEDLPSEPPAAKTEPEQAFALHRLLQHLDPAMAGRWHWKDTRKVLRNIEIIKEYGRLASDVLTDAGRDSLSRYNALIFWLWTSPEVLNTRLDKRVDEMIAHGLLDELHTLHDIGNSQHQINHTLGIYQSIGYKEFSRFLSCPDHSQPSALSEATKTMKINTRKYAQRQLKWIRNKLLPAARACNAVHNDADAKKVHVYVLDTSITERSWEDSVMAPAKHIMISHLLGTPMPDPVSISLQAQNMLETPDRSISPADVIASHRKRICDVCTTNTSLPIMIDNGDQWEAHIRSRGHRRAISRNARSGMFEGIS